MIMYQNQGRYFTFVLINGIICVEVGNSIVARIKEEI